MGGCSVQESVGLVARLLGGVDCNMRLISELGYRGLAAPGSTIATALTILLTLYVAVMGLKLVLGLAPLRMGDLALSALKIGLVLALATDWPAYQQLVFDALFRGPDELAAGLMHSVLASPAGPFDALQVAFDELQASAAFFQRSGPALVSPFSGGTPFAAAALNLGSYLMLFSTLGLILVAKIVLGLLLCLAPVFAGLLLFDSTRGMFAGWIRAALVFALVPLLATVALLVQMILLAPYVGSLAEMRAAGQPDLALANTVFILLAISSAVSVAAMAGGAIVAMGLRLPGRRQSSAPQGHALPASPVISAVPVLAPVPAQTASPAARAISRALERQDFRLSESAEHPRRFQLGPVQHDGGASDRAPSYRASVRPRRLASSRRRDQP